MERDQFPPACPASRSSPPPRTSRIFRPGGNAQDLTALMLAGRMEAIQGKCEAGDKKGTVQATVTAGAMLIRGPAMHGNQVSVPIYVAVTEGDRILDKHVYTLGATFPIERGPRVP